MQAEHPEQGSALKNPGLQHWQRCLPKVGGLKPQGGMEKKRNVEQKSGLGESFTYNVLLPCRSDATWELRKGAQKDRRGGEVLWTSMASSSLFSSRGYDRITTVGPSHIYSPSSPAHCLWLLEGKAPKEHCLVLPAEPTARVIFVASACRLTSLFTRSFDELNLNTSIFLSNGLIVNWKGKNRDRQNYQRALHLIVTRL